MFCCRSYGGFKAKAGETRASEIHITLKGLAMITLYCTLSGLAGVYSEYILKKKYEVCFIAFALLFVFFRSTFRNLACIVFYVRV